MTNQERRLPHLATVGQHAKMLGIKPHQIHYMIRKGNLEPIATLLVGMAAWPPWPGARTSSASVRRRCRAASTRPRAGA